MAFHVACPITCKKICFCKLGFLPKLQTERARDSFLEEVSRISEFLKDPFGSRVREKGTVQVSVPRVEKPPEVVPLVGDGDGGEEALLLLSSQTKRVALQRQAAAASMVAEDFARKFESGQCQLPAAPAQQHVSGEVAGEELGQSNANLMCRMCFHGENVGSQRARKMLSCKDCGKKYHKTCIEKWSHHRDLFHWSSWTCPSCRICEVCRRTGDPNKFMFCKRCDGAYHCYCQQPPHKNVSSGPYLCPKHTRCHSCGSKVPGNGLSLRWFLGYTCCDACGRLFVKGNYCPVCLKVYRDSEPTPMVCCDFCQRWVHCQCDGISDEKYRQFQANGDLQYVCTACRGECYQVNNIEDAVKEMWRRKDKDDEHLIATLRAAAGLPAQEDTFSISQYSDDEENGPIKLKNEFGRSLKFSLKGSADKSPKKFKDFGKKLSNKKHVKKKGYQRHVATNVDSCQVFEEHDAKITGFSLPDNKTNDIQSHNTKGADIFSSPVAGICSTNHPRVLKHRLVDEVIMISEDGAPRVPHGVNIGEVSGKNDIKSKTVKGPKLVIHLGTRNKNITSSPRSDVSSYQKEQDLTISNGSEDTSQQRMIKYTVDGHDFAGEHGKIEGTADQANAHSGGAKLVYSRQSKGSKHRGKEGNLASSGKFAPEISNPKSNFSSKNSVDGEPILLNAGASSKEDRNAGGWVPDLEPAEEVTASRGDKISFSKHLDGRLDDFSEGSHDNSRMAPVQLLPKDSRPLLRLKFKNPIIENHSAWVPHDGEEKSSVKGQRSKRKRPSPLMGQKTTKDEDLSHLEQDNSMGAIMEADWILKKLGKDAIGKRVEVEQPSDDSWHKGVVADVIPGTSTVLVDLDDGRSKTLELGKQGIRFVPLKKKRSRT